MIQVNLQTMGEQKRTDTSIAQELAKAKNVIDKFLYGCSHTMRGPLKSISGLIKLLQNPEATEDPYKHLELIQKTVNKMETILNDLEQFLVNSRRDLVIESVSMSKTIDLILERYSREAESKNVRFSKSITQTVPLFTDVERLNLILIQLISNALVFNDSEKADKHIDIFVRVNENGCHIKVLDNGIGMSSDIQKNIFQLFFRGAQQSQGAGIGLYVVNEVLRKMGGSITVTSEEGCGSSFFVWIPNLKS
jgi:signal transduction histidine kinase